jgi:hypothetical protein
MKLRLFGILGLLITAFPASAGELVGRWTSEFDTQIGVQKYVFEFTKSGDTLAGKATFERSMGNGTAPLKNVTVDGDKVRFEEPLSFDGNEITIVYTGTLAGDELKLERKVGDFATEQVTAKRAAATPAK